MRSLHDELAAVADFRRAQGRKHTVACVLTIHVLAELANMKGCLATAEFARSLSQAELAAVGAWKSKRRRGSREPVSKSTIHRVIQSVDPEALEQVVGRYSPVPGSSWAGRWPPMASVSGAPTGMARIITRPWPWSNTAPAHPLH